MAEYREDCYRALGVTPNATTEEIRQAWLRLISYWHPDRGNHLAAEDRAKELNRAFQILANPDTRADYDRWYRAQAGNAGVASGVGHDAADDDRPPWAASSPPEEPRGPKERRRWRRPKPPPEPPPPPPPHPPPPPPPREARGSTNGAPKAGPVGEAEPEMILTGWEPPPVSYRHHRDVDPFTGRAGVGPGGRAAAAAAPRRVLGYVLWMAGFACWLALLGVSIMIVGSGPSLIVETIVIALDVMCLWTWLFAIAAVFAKRRRFGWWRFWAAELIGALTATCATLLIASIGIATAVLTSPAGVNAFRERSWVGAGLAVLALAGALGALTFRMVWQRWNSMRASGVGRPRWERG